MDPSASSGGGGGGPLPDPPLMMQHQSFLAQAPTLHVIKSTVIHEDSHDVVLHTLKLECRGWTWYTTFHYAQIKALHTAVTTWPWRRYFSRQSGSSTTASSSSSAAATAADQHHHHHHLPPPPPSPAQSIRSGRGSSSRREEATPRGGGGGQQRSNTSSLRMGGKGGRSSSSSSSSSASSKLTLPKAINDESASKTDSVSLSQQRVLYETYLREVVESPMARTCPELMEMLHISVTSFDHRQGPSWREGYLTVRWWAHADDEASGPGTMDEAEDRLKSSVIPKVMLRPGSRRWCVLKNSYLAIYKGRDEALPEAVLLFDTDTVLQGSLFEHGRLVVINNVWRYELRAKDKLDQRQWEAALRSVLARSPWVERSRFAYNRRLSSGFLNDTTCSLSQWYVDGQAAYKAMHTAMTGARSQIFITGLWVSPDVHLLRPPRKHPHSRLDRILELKAKQGVQVYILLFKEAPGMTINSKYSKARFSSLDHRGNIHVVRTGNDLFPHMWCHHENIVCVDQEVAFVGSAGLGLGKYDTPAHEMRDDGAGNGHSKDGGGGHYHHNNHNRAAATGGGSGGGGVVWPGADYINPRVKDFVHVGPQCVDLPGHDRSSVPRMPVHGVHCAVTGFAAMDLCWHFISRWNLARYRSSKESRLPTIVPLGLNSLDPQSNATTTTTNQLTLTTTGRSSSSSRGGGEGGHPAAGLIHHHHRHHSSALSIIPAAAAGAMNSDDDDDDDDHRAAGVGGTTTTGTSAASKGNQQLGVTRKTIARLVFGASSSVSELPPRPADMFGGGGGGGGSQASGGGASGGGSSGIAEAASSKMKEALKSRREKNRQRLLELQHEVGGIQSSELIFQGMTEMPQQPPPQGHASTQDSSSKQWAATMMMGGGVSPAEWMERLANEEDEEEGDDDGRFRSGSDSTSRSLVTRGSGGGGMWMAPSSNSEMKQQGAEEEEEEASRRRRRYYYEHELGKSVGPVSQCRCHVVRSMGLWSGGYKEKQATILEAYEHLIDTAQHFIYLESPFFISGLQGDGVIANRIAEVLCNRIVRAHDQGDPFRVVMVLPLLPVFDGSFQGAPLSTLTGALYWQHRSLHAIRERLAALVPQPAEYLLVLGLRGFTRMSGAGGDGDGDGDYYDDDGAFGESRYVTEQIYVDSRVMIVDDMRAIVGTAAINDRSLLGSRDSEVSVVLEDLQTVSSSMAGHPYSAGEFCHSLRRRLWAEHLGLHGDDDSITDPLSTQTWDLLRLTAARNTAIFQHTFPQALPSDAIRSLDMLKQVSIAGAMPTRGGLNLDVIRVLGDGASEACKEDEQRAYWLARLQGRVVTFPLHFLSDEMPSLQPTMVLADAST